MQTATRANITRVIVATSNRGEVYRRSTPDDPGNRRRRLPATSHGLLATGCRLPATSYRLLRPGLLAADHRAHDLELAVEHDDVGHRANGDPPGVGQAELPGRRRRTHLRRLDQRPAESRDDVLEGAVHGQRAAGQRPVVQEGGF